MDIPQLTPAEAADMQARGALLVDVREDDEWAAGHVPGALHLPLSAVAARWQELPEATTTVFVCRSGGRSQQAALAFAEAGRAGCANLAGGSQAWHAAGLPLEPPDGRVA